MSNRSRKSGFGRDSKRRKGHFVRTRSGGPKKRDNFDPREWQGRVEPRPTDSGLKDYVLIKAWESGNGVASFDLRNGGAIKEEVITSLVQEGILFNEGYHAFVEDGRKYVDSADGPYSAGH